MRFDDLTRDQQEVIVAIGSSLHELPGLYESRRRENNYAGIPYSSHQDAIQELLEMSLILEVEYSERFLNIMDAFATQIGQKWYCLAEDGRTLFDDLPVNFLIENFKHMLLKCQVEKAAVPDNITLIINLDGIARISSN
jgi:hypothetical protein